MIFRTYQAFGIEGRYQCSFNVTDICGIFNEYLVEVFKPIPKSVENTAFR